MLGQAAYPGFHCVSSSPTALVYAGYTHLEENKTSWANIHLAIINFLQDSGFKKNFPNHSDKYVTCKLFLGLCM